ncbi:mandelate racemase/muconate lactonizing enzyme family protein [Mongoliimonas terrestris]|uniref:mandelate racemase/muconate lactonizing enzyme family protein n=1 Tax=Mongoliimonas terrestris TaxID=1709001 RepID=UPI0009497FC1|nr:mandelate racemase/muconate lactonizing enzyme family protein [Mongoliimonas terrestris]
MAKIERITITHHRLPLDPPFVASWDSRPRGHFDATVVRVATDEGHEGVASGDLMLGFAGHEHLFVGEDPLRIERHYRVLSHLDFHYGRSWPLDLALWDLAGKITGQPVWKLLGGLNDKVRAYASSGTLRDPGGMAETAERFLGEGYPAMKIRFQRGRWQDDIKALEAVRARVGDRLTLMVDCNQGWRMPWDTVAPWTFKDALQVGRELERLSVYWMEEPLHRADREGMRRLREAVDVRIAGGEMTRELSAFRDLVRDGCLDVLQPDAALVGGITGLRRVALMAQEHNVAFTPHTWTNGMGVAANAHLTAALSDAPFLEFPYDPPEWSLARRDYMMAEPLLADGEGWIRLGDTPGLGIAPDEERLRATALS